MAKGNVPSQRQQKQTQIVHSHSSYSGPLPPPEILQSYEALRPGATDLIFKTYEEEIAHRHATDLKMLDIEHAARMSESSSRMIGQWLGFIICLAFLSSGTYLIATGHEISGTLFGGGSMAAIVTAFLSTRNKK